MSNLLGQSLGRYHILEQLGEGGMAIVYKAYDTRLERDVAVKVLRTDQFAPAVLERILKRFEREAKALSKLTHPNIVGIIDYGEHEGSPYFVMEYLPGGTLKQRLGKPMPWQEALRLILPIADALAYAHEQNILHRDVKPSNILLTQKDQPMLTDFGVAKILDVEEGQTLTGTGMGVGTPEYMSPEQWTGKVMPQSDVYALGVVLYEMLTGRKPYTADTPAAILLKQATEPLLRPAQYVPGLPDDVEKVLLKALAKRPEDRYQSMGEVVHALEALLRGVAPSVIPPSAPSRPQPAPLREETLDTQATIDQIEGAIPMPPGARAEQAPVVVAPIAAAQPETEISPPQPGWGTWALWTLMTAIGWAVGWAVIGAVVGAVGLAGNGLVIGAVVGAVGGAMTGFGQWLALRRHVRQAGWWILASAIGWAVGEAVGWPVGWAVDGAVGLAGNGLVIGAVVGAVGGAMTGFGQWLVLRCHVRQAGWWILASAIGWAMGEGVGEAVYWVVGLAVAGVVGGGLTGAVMVWLLRRPRLNARR